MARSSQKKEETSRKTRNVKNHTPTIISSSEDEEEEVVQKMDITKEMKKMFKEFKNEIRVELRDFQKSLSFNSDKLDDVLKKMETLQNAMNSIKAKQKNIEEENKELKKKMRELEIEADERDQYSRNRNVQIDGIPHQKDENLEELVKEIGNKIEVTIDNNDIDVVHRIPTFSKNSVEPIVVQFVTRKIRDNVIKKAKINKITTKDINMNGPDKAIFINDHLTRKRKDILHEAKKKKIELNFKYVWSKGGKIYMRKDDSSNVIQLRSLEDLALVK